MSETLFKPGQIIEVEGDPAKVSMDEIKRRAREQQQQEKRPEPQPTPNIKLSLVRKLAEVMAAVGWIEKTGYNEFHKYKYAQEADLVSALRGELAKRHIMVFPHVIHCQRSPHTVTTFKGPRETQLTEIVVRWTFVDGESGEERWMDIHGVGEDNVDKGFYKAFTGSEKYMLMKTFLIPTGDDPEQDSKEDREEAKERGKAAAKAVGEQKAEKMRENASKVVQGLFYAQQPSGLYAITGAENLLGILYKNPKLKAKWFQQDRCFMVDVELLEQVKFQCEQGNISFTVLKGM